MGKLTLDSWIETVRVLHVLILFFFPLKHKMVKNYRYTNSTNTN